MKKATFYIYLCGYSTSYAWTKYLKRHQTLNVVFTGLCDKCLYEFIDWKYSQSCWYFDPSCELAPL
jgi:hypothetical protein